MRPFIHIPDWAIKYIKRDNFSAFEILGHVKASVRRADGYRFVHFDEHNAISTILKTMIATNIQENTTYGNLALDNLFTSVDAIDVGLTGLDGIMVFDDNGDGYATDCTGSGLGWTATGNPGTLTGTFTGYAITIADETMVMLGRYCNGNSADAAGVVTTIDIAILSYRKCPDDCQYIRCKQVQRRPCCW